MIDELDLLTLNGPAGNGQANDPADVFALDNALRRIEAYPPPAEYAAEPQRYPTEPMIRALEKFQEQNGLKIDGYANPNGPTERAINNRLLAKPQGAGLLFDPPAPLAGAVGDGFENRRGDVATVQRILGALDHLPEGPFDRPHGYIDENTIGGIKGFQRKRGLDPDGWLAPGGETERALHDAATDLARAKGGEWLKFAERAGRAQAEQQGRRFPSDLASNATDQRPDARPEAAPEGEIIPAQSRTGFGLFPAPIFPWSRIDPDDQEPVPGSPADAVQKFVGALGRYASGGRYGIGGRRAGLPESDRPGTKLENIPPRVPDEPFRGPDPAKPPLDPKLTRPSPYPAEPPHKPEPERIAPPRIDPRDYIIVLPDLSDWISRFPIIVKNRIGDPPVQELNRELGTPVVKIGEKVFGEGRIEQIGGPKPYPTGGRLKENFESFPYKKEFDIKSNYGGSFEDVSYLITYSGVKVKFVVNTVTIGGDGRPIPRENRQRAKVVLNSRDDTVIIEVDKPKPNERIDGEAWKGFLESQMDYIKYLIDNKIIRPKDDSDPESTEKKTQRILHFFNYYRGR